MENRGVSGTGATGPSVSGSACGSVWSVVTVATGSLISDSAFRLVGSVVTRATGSMGSGSSLHARFCPYPASTTFFSLSTLATMWNSARNAAFGILNMSRLRPLGCYPRGLAMSIMLAHTTLLTRTRGGGRALPHRATSGTRIRFPATSGTRTPWTCTG